MFAHKESDAPSDRTREADGKAGVHEASSDWLLSSRVPHAENEKVSRDDGGLESAQEYAKGNESREVVGESSGNEDYSPDKLDDK